GPRSTVRRARERSASPAAGARAPRPDRATPAGRMTLDADVEITLVVNGQSVRRRVEPRQNLVDFLREVVELTGSHVGCEHGVCGACTVRVDDALVRGCLMFAVQADGCRVETIEGVAAGGEIADLQARFHEENALQCGFCTPGMLLTAQ